MKNFNPSHLMISAFVFATTTIPGVATAAISGETKALFDTVKDVFKDGATLFLTLFGVVIFLAAAFWIFSSIAQWTKGKLDMGEMMIHIFVAIVGIMIALWMIDKAETKKDTIAYQVIESPSIATQDDHWHQLQLSASRV